MPWIALAIGAAVTGGTALLQSNAAGKANKSAQNATQQATDQQIALQREALDRITQLQQPYVNAGYGALDQLGRYYGYGGTPQRTTPANGNVTNPFASSGGSLTPAEIAGPSTAKATGVAVDPASAGPPSGAYTGGIPVTTPGTPATAGGQPDYSAYLAANPDVAARAQQGVAEGIIGPNGQWKTPEEWAAFQYQNTGQSEGRNLPLTQASPGTPDTTSVAPADQALSDAIGQRPTFQTPNFGTAPDQASYFDPSQFRVDPGYEFALKQGLRGQNAAFGARGLLKSSGAIKGAQDYAQGIADQQYGNWWNRQNTLYNEATNQFNADRSANYNIFNNDRNFANGNFEDNRNYATNRYDNTANNLFRLVSLGTGAAGTVGGANTNYANNASNIYGNQGTTNANLALANGATQSQLYGTIGGAISNGINLYGGSNAYNAANPFNGSGSLAGLRGLY